jgi:kumamolisin
MEERFPQRGPYARLTREEFTAVHSADPQDIAQIESFARANNLLVESVFPERRTVILSGTAADFGKAFEVDLVLYEDKGHQYRAPMGPIHLRADLVPLVQGIFGLDNLPIAPLSNGGAGTVVASSLLQLVAAYNFPTGVDGTGQTVGIIDLGGGFLQPDLQEFFQGLGLAVPTIVTVSIDGVVNSPGSSQGRDTEVTGDIETVGAIAPGATIVVYTAPSSPQGLIDAVSTAVNDTANAPSVISISFGISENRLSNAMITSLNSFLAAALNVPITVLAGSGDAGSSNGASDGLAHVVFPSSNPNVTACGGTTLTFTGSSISSEVVWDDPNSGTTGGGVSDLFPLPGYQAGAGVPVSANPAANPGRGVPDVEGHAQGVSIIFQGASIVFNGTSAVSPLWAGLIALINQLRSSRGLGPTGFLNPILYGLLASVLSLKFVE